ncbi:isoleucine--tRNA ligase [Anaeromassilibacillus senegalensis]|uniref:isoleucine--tRNA ligase n=1 Tax=Anaeromassilibacillus senegalensis TaxID=1673717 RepID=UPI00067FCB42|nr:isoleucine--tRNA ligase [Anaeromassilibacillus senegalensis]
MYQKVGQDLSFPEREKKVLEFWSENDIFKKSLNANGEGESYVFYDGPPTANGKPHIGHVLTRVIKDTVPRYHVMKGQNVPRKAGWDTHGLPVELEVERELGLDGKDQIEDYGMEQFIDHCKASVWKYKGMWEEFSDTVGFWADMEHPYVTYDNNFIESEWWALKNIFDRGLLYKGYKIMPYCPRCGTPLSSHEVAQGYKDVKERSAIARFRVKGEENASILAWTTTPWTLPSNVALCVNPEETYAKVQYQDEVLYMAQALLDTVLGENNYTVLETFPGKSMEHMEYEPLYRFVNPAEKCWYVTCDTYVTLTDGTGVVHIAPAFGEDDAKVGRRYGLPFVQLVDAKGEMKPETDWPGVFVKDADKPILEDLKNRGLLFAAPKFEHSYPHCWRCDTPLIYYAREGWFIRMTDVKDDLIANNKTINWIPESMGTGRFGDWLENVQDWAISRDRYWGTPLNVWQCGCGHMHAVGSIEELKELSDNCPDNIELHRPYIDAVTIRCPKCGGEMRRVPEVIDCWFDSGSMPFAQHHYPFENQELFEQQFPADFISEAVDQTRGWFYSLLAISTLLFNKAPFKNVLVLGHVQDQFGQKMSKSKGNAVNPAEALAKYGADPIRWYFLTNSAPWLPNKFYDKAVLDGQRRFLGTLYNTYAFYVLYADIYKFDPTQHKLEKETLSAMDRWILSKLNHMVQGVDNDMENYRLPEAARGLQEFVDLLSNWYVRRSRERFWKDTMDTDSVNAFMTLYTCLETVSRTAAPMIPFMAEEIYQNVVRTVDKDAPESVHLSNFPEVDAAYMDAELEANMDEVLEVVTLGRAARNGAAIKNRQPLPVLYVQGSRVLDDAFRRIVMEELNVKDVQFVDDAASFMDYSFKPQLKTVGPKYGKQLGEIRTALSELNGVAAKQELDTTGELVLNLPSGEVKLTADDLLISVEQKEGAYTVSDHGRTVALDTHITEELREEGFLREVVSKLQTMRKESGAQVTDHVKITYQAGEYADSVIQKNCDFIMSEVLAEALDMADPVGYVKEWDVNGETVTFGLEQA